MLSDSMFTLQFLHRAAKKPVAALRLFRSYLHFLLGAVLKYFPHRAVCCSLEARRLGRDEHIQKVCRADQKDWLS